MTGKSTQKQMKQKETCVFVTGTNGCVNSMRNRTRNNQNHEKYSLGRLDLSGLRIGRREHAILVDVDEIEVGVDLGHKTESRK